MPSRAELRREFQDYKKRVYKRRAGTREAPSSAGAVGGAVAASPGRIGPQVLLPLFLLSLAGLLVLLARHGVGGNQGNLRVAKMRGSVRATDGLKDWDLQKDQGVYAGQTVVCGANGSVELRAVDPDTRLLVFENGRFRLDALRKVDEQKYLMEGTVTEGEVFFDFRSENALWAIDVAAPTGTHFLSKGTIMFKVAVDGGAGRGEDEGARVTVGDGAVMVIGPGGSKAPVHTDQRMVVTSGSPVGKAEGVNVLSERWNF